jgi:TFIIF-interacting CTD phosphatase-like protein
VTYKTAEYDAMTAIHMPLTERVLDRLADILVASDDILDMLRMDHRLPDHNTRDVETSVLSVYNQINDLMKKLAD